MAGNCNCEEFDGVRFKPCPQHDSPAVHAVIARLEAALAVATRERDEARCSIAAKLAFESALASMDHVWFAPGDGPYVRLSDIIRALAASSPGAPSVRGAEGSGPAYCPVHQHYKWCEHNGGILGATGHEAPPAPEGSGSAPEPEGKP